MVAVGIGAAAAAAAAAAAPGATITVGSKVAHPSGATVGTITAIGNNLATVRTDRHEVQLPLTSFTPGKDGFLIALTRDQLNAEADRSIAAAQARLTPGISVTGSAGSVVGTLESISADYATLRLTSGRLVKVPRSGIAPGPQGAVVGISAAQLEATVAADANGT